MNGEQLTKLKSEITNDPITRGYSGMTDTQIANSLNNTLDRTITRERITSAELYESIDLTEYTAKSAAEKSEIQTFLGMSEIFARQGSKARARIIAIFGVNSATIANLRAIAEISNISRATELGLPFVGTHHVTFAKAL